MPHKCKFCDKVLASLPSHVKAVHPKEYKKGQRAESYGTLVADPEGAKKSPKPKKKKEKVVKPRIHSGALQELGKDATRTALQIRNIGEAESQFIFASLMKEKGQRVEGIGLRPTLRETRRNKTIASSVRREQLAKEAADLKLKEAADLKQRRAYLETKEEEV